MKNIFVVLLFFRTISYAIDPACGLSTVTGPGNVWMFPGSGVTNYLGDWTSRKAQWIADNSTNGRIVISCQFYRMNPSIGYYEVTYKSLSINGTDTAFACQCIEDTPSDTFPEDNREQARLDYKCAGPVGDIVGVECVELGREDPTRPFTPGLPVDNGIYVRLIYEYSSVVGYDTQLTVLSGGCAAVTVDSVPVPKMNAHDDSVVMDGVKFPVCYYAGQVLNGTCNENGLDTSCGGQVSGGLPPLPDSIINPCAALSPPAPPRPDDSIQNNSDSAVTGSENAAGVNRLSSDLRTEHGLDRAEMGKQLDESKKHTGILEGIKGILVGINNNMKKGFSDLIGIFSDSSGVPSLDGYGSFADTSGGLYSDTGSFPVADTGSLFTNFRNKYRGDTLDTVTMSDTAMLRVKSDSLFAPFIVNFHEGDCDCDPEWFKMQNVSFVDNGVINIDICPYQLNVIMKPFLLLMAAFVLFLFYRDHFFKAISESF